jgi:Outer membrane protein beta-barrel domain
MKVTAKYLLVALLACTAGAVQAHYDDYASESRDCCFSSCYECGCNPLYCGAWDLQIQAGVNPITWRNRGNIISVECIEAAPDLEIAPIEKFSFYFKTPWIVGGQIGYHWSDNARVYLEFNYSQAKSKDQLVPFVNLTKYKIFDAYVGARYYWDRWCDRVAFFLGAKVGLTHHKGVDTDLAVDIGGTITVLTPGFSYFSSNNVVSGGADFGFDVCFCGNWSFVVTGSVLASCGPRFNANVVFPANQVTNVTNILQSGVGTELRFPVTAGIRYSF